METGETCLYNKSIKNKHKEVYGMKKKMMMALMASMVLSTVLGAAGTAKACINPITSSRMSFMKWTVLRHRPSFPQRSCPAIIRISSAWMLRIM